MSEPRIESQRFLSPAPVVRLEKAFDSPFRNVIATARTCYSSRGIIGDGSVQLELFNDTRDSRIARSIYGAGHHTTFQHAQFQFTLDNVSRHFIWSFLHQHPFYNSEQVSQRFVEVRPGTVAVPPLTGEALETYLETVEMQNALYRELLTELEPVTAEAYFERFPYRAKYADKYRRDIRKKVQEIARYVLPVGTFAYLYHTISALTLLRYWRLSEMFDTPLEQRIVVGAMVRALLEHDPNYAIILEEPLPIEETPEYRLLQQYEASTASSGFIREFDEDLGDLTSRLVDYSGAAESVLASSVREVLGLSRAAMSDDDAIDAALDPRVNTLLGENLTLTTHAKVTRALHHPHYTFRRRLSHTADSQDQRHRMTPGSRPILAAQVTDEPDYYLPELIARAPDALARYREGMERTWAAIVRLEQLGAPREFAMYLLPNAVNVRYTESADLLNLHHKHKMRLCYNAQEEIWRASLDEARQIAHVHPRIGRWLLPPCTIRERAGTRPTCPEGERFCGIKVWKLQTSEYERVI